MDKRKLIILIIAIILVLSGCADSSLSGKPTTLSGRVADGYLVGAKVCIDLNTNLKCDDHEPQNITDRQGYFRLSIAEEEAAQSAIVAEISKETIDLDDGTPVGIMYTLTAPPQSTFISPITSMIQSLTDKNQWDEAQAEKHVKEIFGFDENSSLLSDYIESENQDIHDAARKIASIMGEGIEEAKALIDSDLNDKLEDRDFSKIYSVIIQKIEKESTQIKSSSLKEIKKHSQIKSGGFFNWDNANELNGEVEKRSLDVTQSPIHVEMTASSGFHHLTFDHQNCIRQNTSSQTGIPVSGGNGIADYPLPFGIPISDTLKNQPVCTPDIYLSSQKTEGNVLTKSLYKFDSENKDWIKKSQSPSNRIQLSNNGRWNNLSEDDNQIVFNADGSATVSRGSRQEVLSFKTANLSGKPFSVAFSSIGEDTRYKNPIINAATNELFPQGALAIRQSFTQLNTSYEIPIIDCQDGNSIDYNGNCNVLIKPDGNVATSVDASLFLSTEDSQTVSKSSFHIGAFNIQLQILPSQMTDFSNTHSGPVHFSSTDSTTLNKNIEIGKWTRGSLHDRDLYVIDLPLSTHDQNQDSSTRVKTIFFTEQEGYVRYGMVFSEGETNIDEDWYINDQALENLTRFLQTL
jgi:hypothetical protein